ncbi:Pycsar system effector family protein [Streptomyces sp. NPDC006649]|uniref:Pycsar system effector family protein n=1 Tax=Streptomyces sp. NPDC006649 TaxID=3156896 RepID=UPI0033AC95A2
MPQTPHTSQSADRTDTNLDAALAHTVSEISRTDTKAGLLLTLDGLLVAALSFLGTHVHGLALVLAVLGAVALVGAVVLALLVIRPRLAAPGQTVSDRGHFGYYATADPAEIAETLSEDRRPVRLQALSRIALRKMLQLRRSGDASLLAVVTIAAAILTR